MAETPEYFDNVTVGQYAMTGVPLKVYVNGEYLTITDPDDVENPLIGFGMLPNGEMEQFDYKQIEHLLVSGNVVDLETYKKAMEDDDKEDDDKEDDDKEDDSEDDSEDGEEEGDDSEEEEEEEEDDAAEGGDNPFESVMPSLTSLVEGPASEKAQKVIDKLKAKLIKAKEDKLEAEKDELGEEVVEARGRSGEELSMISKSRAKASLRQIKKGKRDDGMGKFDAKLYGVDVSGDEHEITDEDEINIYKKFGLRAIEESVNEGKVDWDGIAKEVADKLKGGYWPWAIKKGVKNITPEDIGSVLIAGGYTTNSGIETNIGGIMDKVLALVKESVNEMKMVHKGKDITKYVLDYMEKKITKAEFEKLTGLKKDKLKVNESVIGDILIIADENNTYELFTAELVNQKYLMPDELEDPETKEWLETTYAQVHESVSLKSLLPNHESVNEGHMEAPFEYDNISEPYSIKVGDMVQNTNPSCPHHKSQGMVKKIIPMPNDVGNLIKYIVMNQGDTYQAGDVLTKTIDQLEVM